MFPLGLSLLMIGLNQDLFLVDPFTGILYQKLQPHIDNVFKMFDVKMHWCSNKIVVLYGIKGSRKYCIQVFSLGNGGNVDSLCNSALKAVLTNYSINDLMKMNLPKSIKKYFMN